MEKTNSIVVSAPGKIHLMGEHAVVWGKPALLTAIDRRLYVEVSRTDKELEIETPIKKLVEKAVGVVSSYLQQKELRVRIKITSLIPAGKHIGSSAAVSVASVAGLLFFLKKIWNPSLFNELAYQVEKFQHGNPSGGDNSVVTFGGLVYFRKEFEFLKSIWQLPFKIADDLNNCFYLIDTGFPVETTGEMVAWVAEWIKRNSKKGQIIFSENERATKEITLAIKNGDTDLLISAIKRGERTLEELGVVSRTAKLIIRKIEETGSVAKVLGGGGRKEGVGFILVFTREKDKIEKIAKAYNCRFEAVKLGEEGVRLERH